MNERLNQQDFIDLLAEKHGMNKKDADKFVKEFFLLIEKALTTDKIVKVKGLGTFKLVDVDSRESVNINTGERFQIQGYTKVSFIPDNSLRDVINKPFAHFETVVLNDNIVLEDTLVVEEEEEEEKEEITEEESDASNDVNLSEQLVVGESQKGNIADECPENVLDKTDVVEEKKTLIEEVISEMNAVPIEKYKLSADEIIAREIKASAPLIESPVKEKRKRLNVEKKESSSAPYLIVVIIIVLLLCGGAVLFIYYPDLFDAVDNNKSVPAEDRIEKPIESPAALIDTTSIKDTVPETASPEVEEKVTVSPMLVNKKQEVVKKEEEAVKKESKAPFTPDSVTYMITGTKTTYTIKEGETLTKVALRFYGTKTLWPYIVKYNTGKIKNPDNIPYGTTINIPELVKK